MGEKNRHFGREFKRDAVQLVTEKGIPVGKVARELDIHPNLLHLWGFLAREGVPALVIKDQLRRTNLKTTVDFCIGSDVGYQKRTA
jgi:transposase